MRLGIFGGTFDPIHNAHLFLAESARLLENLDRVLFVPTERKSTTAMQRRPMRRIAVP